MGIVNARYMNSYIMERPPNPQCWQGFHELLRFVRE